jgi:hypothetical protein
MMSVFAGKTPIQGGSVIIRVSFRDEGGAYYIPVDGSVFYALVAQNNDKETWTSVRSWTPLPSASVADVVVQGKDLELLPGCTLSRCLLIDWRYLRGGEEVVGREEVSFRISPLPVTDPPLGQVPPLPVPDAPVSSDIEDTIDGLDGFDVVHNLLVRVSGGFVEMCQGPVWAGSVAEGLRAFVYSFSAPGEVQLVGVHGDTHEVSVPIFRATLKANGGRWVLTRVGANEMGLEAGAVFNL